MDKMEGSKNISLENREQLSMNEEQKVPWDEIDTIIIGKPTIGIPGLKLTYFDSGLSIVIYKKKVSVGRHSECDIRIDSKCHYVAREQAYFFYENSTWYCMDNISKNGTWMNGEKMSSNQPHPLKQGDVIDFAKSVKMFVGFQNSTIPKVEMTIVKGDITKMDCDCIVNAANKTLLGGGGVDGAIHRAAGLGLLKECISLGGCKTGEAKITKGYKLKVPYIIHTVGPVYSGKQTDRVMLKNCYYNSLTLAKKYNIHSIAFPAISTGVYKYPLEEAAIIAIETTRLWLSENPEYSMEVYFVCFDEATYNVYNRIK